MTRIACLFASSLILASCSVQAPSQRYEMTAVVETPGGTVVRSGVWRVDKIGSVSPFTGGVSYSKVKGEAVAIPLGGRRYLLMLAGSMGGSWANMAPWQEISDPRFGNVIDGGRVQMNQPPHFVYFSDIGDMKSGREVRVRDDRSALGPGYVVKGVWMQRTSKPMTTGIRDVVTWVDHIDGDSIQGGKGCLTRSRIPCVGKDDLLNEGR